MGLENEAKEAKRAGRANGQRLTRRRVPLSCVACRVSNLHSLEFVVWDIH
jgi:hypothetical protein